MDHFWARPRKYAKTTRRDRRDRLRSLRVLDRRDRLRRDRRVRRTSSIAARPRSPRVLDRRASSIALRRDRRVRRASSIACVGDLRRFRPFRRFRRFRRPPGAHIGFFQVQATKILKNDPPPIPIQKGPRGTKWGKCSKSLETRERNRH